MIRLALVLALALTGLSPLLAVRAHAQALTLPALRIDHALLAGDAHWGPTAARRGFPFAAALAADPSVEARASTPRQRTARRVLAAGLGFSLAGAITPIYVLPSRSRCWSTGRMSGGAPLKGAAVVGAIGVGMAIGGGSWLGVEARRHGLRTSRRERLIAMRIGALTFTLGQAALVPVFFADQICNT
jgi:hypothetical protein